MTGTRPPEGRYDINRGQYISLTGTVRALPVPDSLSHQWDFEDAVVQELENDEIYLEARSASNVPE